MIGVYGAGLNTRKQNKPRKNRQDDNFLPENFCSGTVTENKTIIRNNSEQTFNPKHL